MKRKSFILLITVVLLSFATISFADDMGNNVKNAVNGATNTVVDGVQNLAEDVRSGISTAENTIENGVRDVGNAVMDGANDVMDTTNTVVDGDNNGDTNYMTTRTIGEDTSIINSTAATTWTWIAIAIAGLVIVGLVWYYASERTHKH